MASKKKTLNKVLRGLSDSNISFVDLCQLLLTLGFDERIKGGHHIFSKESIEEIINIQAVKSKAKAYQVKQIRNLIIKYKLAGDDE